MIKKDTYKVRLSIPHISDEILVCSYNLLKSNISETYFLNKEFEEKFKETIGAKYSLTTNSGTSALHLALLALNISEGDEVICPSFTFIATANVIRYVNACPVFVDSEDMTLNMDPEILEFTIRDRMKVTGKVPKAVIVVHGYGVPAKIREIVGIARRYDIKVVEDAAGGLGSAVQGQSIGTFGDLGAFSFNRNKIITTGGGGMLVSNDSTFIDRAKYLCSQAKIVPHEYVHDDIGYNYVMHPFAAALGICQIPMLKDKILKRRYVAEFYRRKIKDGFEMISEPHGYFFNRWMNFVLCESESNRKSVEERLNQAGIEYRRGWLPLHRQKPFMKFPVYQTDVSESVYSRMICLPSSETICETEMNYVTDCLSLNNHLC